MGVTATTRYYEKAHEPILDVAQPRDANGIMASCPKKTKKYLKLAPAKYWTGPGEMETQVMKQLPYWPEPRWGSGAVNQLLDWATRSCVRCCKPSRCNIEF